LLVEGVAGIGKSSLLARACGQASERGMTVLTATAAEFESGYAWGIVRQLFGRALGPGGCLQAHGDAADLAALALGQAPRGSEEDYYAILHGLYWLTATLAQQAPLLLAVDDLHWADRPSMRYLTHLARRLTDLPVLLLATVREPRADSDEQKVQMASLAAQPGVTVLRPAALSAAACASLVRGALGEEPLPEFGDACVELTCGNPLLLHALLASLAADGAKGTCEEIPHLRRLTPSAVSRNVLLQLGRMPAGAPAVARAVAVLGTTATVARASRLAGIHTDDCAELVAIMMAEGLIEGDRTLRFVHPLVRSVVYADLAPPLRQTWHLQAARMLTGEGAALEDITVHLLAAASTSDPWVVGMLRRAAADARGRGAPDVARLCLERALAEPPTGQAREDVLFELGTAETMQDPVSAVGHLYEALQAAASTASAGAIALALSEALALSGRFAEATELLIPMIRQTSAEHPALSASLQGALLSVARWDLSTRAATRLILEQLQSRAAQGEQLDPQLHANLAIELAAIGADRGGAVRHARLALQALPQLLSANSTALPESISVLLFADLNDEAQGYAQAWLRLAQGRGWQLSSAIAASMASLTALYDGEISAAIAYGQQAIDTAKDVWIAPMAAALLIPALIERGSVAAAQALLADAGLTGELEPTWPYLIVRHARGCLRAAAGDHEAAVADLLRAGELADRWGIGNPAMMPWRSDAALSLSVLGDSSEARRLCTEEIALARRWGGQRALGRALRVAGIVHAGKDGTDLLAEAETVLRCSRAPLELARVLTDLGAAQRRAGNRAAAADLLREGLDLAHLTGSLALAADARRELVVAGFRPRRNALRGRDALTPGELRVAALAADGKTNRQIAQALFVAQRTVEIHLTSAYSKLGIKSRPELSAALSLTGVADPGARLQPHSRGPAGIAEDRNTRRPAAASSTLASPDG
jgi:DNA-binding CsgD family transcriptional regulator